MTVRMMMMMIMMVMMMMVTTVAKMTLMKIKLKRMQSSFFYNRE